MAETQLQSAESWLEECRSGLMQARDQAALVAFVKQSREKLALSPRSTEGIALMRMYTILMDLVIARLFEMAIVETAEEIGANSEDVAQQIAVAATGGYGRRELCPFSDVDVVFIAQGDESLARETFVRKMFHLIMDVFLTGVKLKVGYAYRQPDQLRGLPQETQTALLDARRLAGSEAIFQSFQQALNESIDPLRFLRNNRRQRQDVRKRFGQSPHRVEPNIKEGAGGLRDIHAARWAAQVTFGVSGDRALDELLARGALSQSDVSQFADALEFLSGVRNLLHLSSGRGNDALTVERQQAVASYVQSPETLQSPEALMGLYYSHAENVDYLLNKALDFCDEQQFAIEPGVFAEHGQVQLGSPIGQVRNGNGHGYPESPNDSRSVTRIVDYAQRYGLQLSRETQDAIRTTIRSGRLEPDADSYKSFLSLLNSSQAASTVGLIARLGVLQWLLPEFGALMRLLPGDAAHQHTVGEHSLQVVRNLDALKNDEDEEIRGIFSEVKDRRTLFLAGLLHDVGKISSNGNHAEVGESMAAECAKRLGLSSEDTAKVSFLVRWHLLMGETARLRDLNEPKTVSEFLNVVSDIDLLRMLFLLTLADFRAVGDDNWSAVHVRFLRELYHRASRNLSSPMAQDFEIDIERHRRRVRRELTLANLDPAEVDEHSACMPVAYLLNTSPEDMAMHIESVRQVRSGAPVVELRDDRMSEFTKLTICAFDDPTPGLLAKIAGVLYAQDVDIHAAEVFTRECSDVIALDTLYIDFEQCQLPEFKKRQVASDLTNVLTGNTSVKDLLLSKSKATSRALDVHDLTIHSHLSDRHTVLEISVEDCEGLLYFLTRTIASLGWNTHNARVTTFSGRATDAFYVTDTEGNKLEPDAIQQLLEALAAVG
jgi:[protein-PII] uridylyltransferase